jgi:hypothetical protein
MGKGNGKFVNTDIVSSGHGGKYTWELILKLA